MCQENKVHRSLILFGTYIKEKSDIKENLSVKNEKQVHIFLFFIF
jgi:hypothetical protein